MSKYEELLNKLHDAYRHHKAMLVALDVAERNEKLARCTINTLLDELQKAAPPAGDGV